MKVRSDETVRRFQARWIGTGHTQWPVHARFLAWGLFMSIAGVATLLQYLSPAPMTAGSVVWGLGLSVMATMYLMSIVDKDRPLSSLWPVLWAELHAPVVRDGKPLRRAVCTYNVRVVKDR